MAFKGLSLTQVFSITLVIAAMLTVISYFRHHETIKHRESKLTTWEKIKLYLIRFLHYGITTFYAIYPLFAKIEFKNDLIVFVVLIIIYLHRPFFGECILSITEKQILDKSYIGGTEPSYEPFWELIQIFYNDDIFERACHVILGLRVLYGIIKYK
jgi:hypothetical protein